MTPAKPSSSGPARRRRSLLALLLLPLLVLIVHGLGWWWMTGMIAAGFADWTAVRRAEGWSVEHDPPRRAGWPIAAELVVPALHVEARGRGQAEPVAHDAERLVLAVRPPHLRRLVLRWEGAQRLRLGALEVPFTAERLEAVVPLEPLPQPRGMEIEAEGVQAVTPAGPAAARHAWLRVGPGAVGPEPAMLVGLRARGVSLPDRAVAPAVAAFGPQVQSVSLEAALTGPPPLPPSAARAWFWRDAGGALDLRRATLRWGPLDGEARLRLTLDAALQPTGAGELRLTDAGSAIAATEAAGLLPRSTARAAQAVAALMSRVPPDGGPAQMTVPVAVSEGRLSVARIPLLTFAPLAWP